MTPNTFTEFSKILLFSFKLVIVVFCWIIFCNTNSHHHVKADNRIVNLREVNYDWIKRMYSLVDPYELPNDYNPAINPEDLTSCTCPRVFFPVCGVNEETYINACVLKCINQTTVRRFGPCIQFRRMNAVVLNLPASWKNPNSIGLQADDELDVLILMP